MLDKVPSAAVHHGWAQGVREDLGKQILKANHSLSLRGLAALELSTDRSLRATQGRFALLKSLHAQVEGPCLGSRVSTHPCA